MFLRFLNRTRKTIGFRLTLWYSAIFIVSSLFLFVLTYFFLSISIQLKDREVIQYELKEGVDLYNEQGIEGLKKEVEFHKHTIGRASFFVRLKDPENITKFLHIPEPLEFDPKKLMGSEDKDADEWSYLPTRDGKDIVEIGSLRLEDGSLLQVGGSTAKRKKLLQRFRYFFAVITIPVIIIGFAGGAFFAFRALRPVQHLIITIRSIIDSGKIEARVPAGPRGDELDELSLILNKMLVKIETLIKGMRDSLDNVAHDLLTPMTRLRGIAEIALQSEQNTDVLREGLSDCAEESERILILLNTLMEISEAEAGVIKLQLEQVNVTRLMGEVAELYRYVADEKNIRIIIHTQKELLLNGDPGRLRQVLANLLDNAVKYTPNGGRIDLEAFEEHQKAVIIVRDTGIGISPEELPRIWDRLYRGDKSRSQRGLGLGLSLVKAIVQAHNGSLEVSSEVGIGSVFTIHLPIRL